MKANNVHGTFQEFRESFRSHIQVFYAGKIDNHELMRELNNTASKYKNEFANNKFYKSRFQQTINETRVRFKSGDDDESIIKNRDQIISSIEGLVKNFRKFNPAVSEQGESRVDILDEKFNSEKERVLKKIKEKCDDFGMEKLRSQAIETIQEIMSQRIGEIQELKRNASTSAKITKPITTASLIAEKEANNLIKEFSSFVEKTVAQDCDNSAKKELLIGKQIAILIELEKIFGNDTVPAKGQYLQKISKIMQDQSNKLTTEVNKKKPSSLLSGFFGIKRNSNPAKAPQTFMAFRGTPS